MVQPSKSVETSLDAADTSVRATRLSIRFLFETARVTIGLVLLHPQTFAARDDFEPRAETAP
jgi:hypothetical protein